MKEVDGPHKATGMEMLSASDLVRKIQESYKNIDSIKDIDLMEAALYVLDNIAQLNEDEDGRKKILSSFIEFTNILSARENANKIIVSSETSDFVADAIRALSGEEVTQTLKKDSTWI